MQNTNQEAVKRHPAYTDSITSQRALDFPDFCTPEREHLTVCMPTSPRKARRLPTCKHMACMLHISTINPACTNSDSNNPHNPQNEHRHIWDAILSICKQASLQMRCQHYSRTSPCVEKLSFSAVQTRSLRMHSDATPKQEISGTKKKNSSKKSLKRTNVSGATQSNFFCVPLLWSTENKGL